MLLIYYCLLYFLFATPNYIIECKTNFKVNCDLVVLTNNNKMYNKTNLRIKKCYTDYKVLIEELNKKRG